MTKLGPDDTELWANHYQDIEEMNRRTHKLPGGGFVHVDRQVVPITSPACSICKRPTDGRGAFDEDESFWCIECMKVWETQHHKHWEDGQPIKVK